MHVISFNYMNLTWHYAITCCILNYMHHMPITFVQWACNRLCNTDVYFHYMPCNVSCNACNYVHYIPNAFHYISITWACNGCNNMHYMTHSMDSMMPGPASCARAHRAI